jgi:hypothetical protein
VRSDTWPHQPAAANAQIPLANGEPSIHGRLLTSLGRYSFPKADVEHTNSHDRNLSSPSCANTLEPTWFDPRLDALGRTRAEPPSNYPVPSHTFSWVSVKSATASTKCLRRLQVLLLRTTPRTCHRDAGGSGSSGLLILSGGFCDEASGAVDGVAFDPFSLPAGWLAAPEVDVGGGEIVEALVVAR